MACRLMAHGFSVAEFSGLLVNSDVTYSRAGFDFDTIGTENISSHAQNHQGGHPAMAYSYEPHVPMNYRPNKTGRKRRCTRQRK